MSDLVSPALATVSQARPMLTPVVTATAATSTSIRPHATGTQIGAGHSPVVLTTNLLAALKTVGLDEPAGSLLAAINAVAATSGGRQTVLEVVARKVATALSIVPRQDEKVAEFFSRLAATIDKLTQPERFAIELRTGLRGLQISLADLAQALRNPDGPVAARIAALAETPNAIPAKAATNAAISAYQQTDNGSLQAAETAAMRGSVETASENFGVFSGEIKAQAQESAVAGAKVLQQQLKLIFEPGAEVSVPVENATPQTGSEEPTPTDALAAAAEPDAIIVAESMQEPELPLADKPAKEMIGAKLQAQSTPPRLDAGLAAVAREAKAFATTQAVEKAGPEIRISHPDAKIGAAATRLREQAETVMLAKAERQGRLLERANETNIQSDRRQQTMLALKGLAEAIILAPARLTAAPTAGGDPAPMTGRLPHAQGEATLAAGTPAAEGSASLPSQRPEPSAAAYHRQFAGETTADAIEGDRDSATAADAKAQTDAARGTAQSAARSDEQSQLAKIAQNPELVPFAYAQLAPARDSFKVKTEETERHGQRRDQEDGDDQASDEDGENRRPRDEYDELREPQEDAPVLALTRDSSEADRAYAHYQRMGGF